MLEAINRSSIDVVKEITPNYGLLARGFVD
jgi:hypothetical protein